MNHKFKIEDILASMTINSMNSLHYLSEPSLKVHVFDIHYVHMAYDVCSRAGNPPTRDELADFTKLKSTFHKSLVVLARNMKS